MKKAAAIMSLLIAMLLLLTVGFAFGIEVHREMEKNTPEAREKAVQDAMKGVVTIGNDEVLNGTTELVLTLAGGAFIVAGLALWPRRKSN